MDPVQNPQNPPQTPPYPQPIPVQQPTNQVSPTQTPSSPPESFAYTPSQKQGKKKSLKKLLIGFIVVAVVFLFILTPVLFAYGYIPAGKTIRDGFENVIVGLPLMPKTQRYIIRRSVKALKNVNTYTFDGLSSIQSSQYKPLLGIEKIDIKSTGSVDKSDMNNIKISQTISLSSDFALNLIMSDNKLYIKINSIPSNLTTLITTYGIPNSMVDELRNKWLFFDFNSIPAQKGSIPPAQIIRELFDVSKNIQILTTILDNPQASKSLILSSDTLDGQPVYKIAFKPDKQTIGILLEQYQSLWGMGVSIDMSKLSNVYEDISSDSWIDKKDYLARKNALSMTYNPIALMPSTYKLELSAQKIPITIVSSFSDFNKPVSITPPKDAEKFQDFFTRAISASASNSASLVGQQLAQANDMKRRSDINMILNAINEYAADNKGVYPPGITTKEQPIRSTGSNLCKYLVPTYLAALPVDPKTSNNSIASCNAPYDTGYTVKKDADGKITVTAPNKETSNDISVTR